MTWPRYYSILCVCKVHSLYICCQFSLCDNARTNPLWYENLLCTWPYYEEIGHSVSILLELYTVKKVSDFFRYSRRGRVWLVTSRLGTGKSLTFFYSVRGTNELAHSRRILRSSRPQEIFQPPQRGFFSVHAQLQVLGNIFQLFTPHLTSTHLTPDYVAI